MRRPSNSAATAYRKRSKEQRWREIAAGERVAENLSAVFKLSPPIVEAIPKAEVSDDFEAKREGASFADRDRFAKYREHRESAMRWLRDAPMLAEREGWDDFDGWDERGVAWQWRFWEVRHHQKLTTRSIAMIADIEAGAWPDWFLAQLKSAVTDLG